MEEILNSSEGCLKMTTEDEYGLTPFHCYMRNPNVTADVVELLFHEDPDIFLAETSQGHTAIYRYFGNKTISIPVIDMLLALNPEGLTRKAQDGQGITPVHTVRKNGRG